MLRLGKLIGASVWLFSSFEIRLKTARTRLTSSCGLKGLTT